MPVFPLRQQTREQLVERLMLEIGNKDPLPFLQKNIFDHYQNVSLRILPSDSSTSWMYFDTLIRNIELAAWATRPPLLVTLLRAFPQALQYESVIKVILNEGPFQCHPQNVPYNVCRVATELPLVGRDVTRAAGLSFDLSTATHGTAGTRVLRVFGPSGSGKTHTLNFFKYLENVQPAMLGVVEIDFKNPEVVTQAASADVYIELFIAERMEAQVRRRRNELKAGDPAAGDFPDLLAVAASASRQHKFKTRVDVKARSRWAQNLANEFLDEVVFKLNQQPLWWVVVFDNCELAPAETHEFIRRLIERAAGMAADQTSVRRADAGQLRVVLLGDSDDLLPAGVYNDHVIEEDLNNQQLGKSEVQRYFITYSLCRDIPLDAAQIERLTDETLTRAQEIAQPPPPADPVLWPRALATAIIEKTLPLDALAAQNGGGD